ncbi:hypothetical protein BDW02DRAFT_626744 [Decorospora gaudefroyi]|uniref:Transmembrane protein n=1 Tax=Decorospora gaudefroyi TaxID=184978 RepID=A0A6A5KRZ3_9PLEO|nr:hypothetical protein BDW02DRAFT_626744 [Decorospora gaudefroyi]
MSPQISASVPLENSIPEMPARSSTLHETEDVGVVSSDISLRHRTSSAKPDMTTAASTANNNVLQIGERPGQHEQNASNVKSQVVFGNSNSGLQAGIIYGNIHDVTFNYAESQSIFGGLAQGTRPLDDSTLDVLARRARVQAGRKLPRQGSSRLLETPNSSTAALQNISKSPSSPSGKQHAKELLHNARKTISKIQNLQNDPISADVGDLGHFCEQIARMWDEAAERKPKFTITQRRDEEILHYLQDALEIPYWEFMVDIFLGWKANLESLSGDAVLRVLHSTKLELLDGRRRLLDDMVTLQGDEVEDIAPILDGIDARIAILGSLWNSASSNFDDAHYSLVALLESPQQSPALAVEEVLLPSLHEQRGLHEMETVTLVALIIVFLTAAIILGYKAFAISMQSRAVGSTGNADFWYQIQSSIMAVMGNIIMVVPLLKKSWFSPAYGLMWAFFALGLAFAFIAVILYPLVNPGWSFMVAFFASIASAASVLSMTLASARERNNVKVKSD